MSNFPKNALVELFDPGSGAHLAEYVQRIDQPIDGPGVLLLYSGGLDTSCCIKFIQEAFNVPVIAMTCDVGQQENFTEIGDKAKALGAEFVFVDARKEFYQKYLRQAILLNATYFDAHPLASSMSRQIVSECAARIAAERGIKVIAHGATGRGNDSFRFDNALLSRVPGAKLLAPIRNNHITRDKEIEFAEAHGIPVVAKKGRSYSIDENMWGREIEAGGLDDLEFALPNDVLAWVKVPAVRTELSQMGIQFEKGEPVRITLISGDVSTEFVDIVEAIGHLNRVLGEYGIGRHDYLEERASGLKVREIHESPAASVIIKAHKMLENATLTSLELKTKQGLETTWVQCMVSGRLDPVVHGIEAMARVLNERVSGEIGFDITPGQFQLARMKVENGLDFASMHREPQRPFNHDLVAPAIELMDSAARRALRFYIDPK